MWTRGGGRGIVERDTESVWPGSFTARQQRPDPKRREVGEKRGTEVCQDGGARTDLWD